MSRQIGDSRWVDVLGLITSTPRAALEEIVAKPHFLSGLVVVGLAVLGRTLTDPLPWDAGLIPLGRGFFTVFLTGLISGWAGPALTLHVISRIFKKEGNLTSLLAVTGWASVALWPLLAIRLAESGGFLLSFISAVFIVCNILMWGWGVRRVYGWSNGRVVILLPVAYVLFSIFSSVAMAIFKIFLPLGHFLSHLHV